MQSSRKHGFKPALLAGLLVVCGLATDARAGDGKVYPASVCTGLAHRGINGNITVDRRTDVWCPLIGDSNATATGGMNVAKVFFYESPDDAARSTCTLRSYGATGTLFDSTAGTVGGTKVQTLSIPLARTTGGPASPRYALQCQLSTGSTLHEIEVEER